MCTRAQIVSQMFSTNVVGRLRESCSPISSLWYRTIARAGLLSTSTQRSAPTAPSQVDACLSDSESLNRRASTPQSFGRSGDKSEAAAMHGSCSLSPLGWHLASWTLLISPGGISTDEKRLCCTSKIFISNRNVEGPLPAFSKTSASQREDIICYLRSLFST